MLENMDKFLYSYFNIISSTFTYRKKHNFCFVIHSMRLGGRSIRNYARPK
jgi:hypothetical protein